MFTLSPSDCFALSSSGPATNEPLGAAFGHSKTYKSRPPSAADFAATRDGESDLPVPATANVSGTVKRNVPVYRFVGYAVSGNQRAGSNRYAPSLYIEARRMPGTGLLSSFASGPV